MKIYTDGACSGNPGPGGWAAIIPIATKDPKTGEVLRNNIILSDGKKETTNNEMELLAVVKALQAIEKPENVTIFSDSAYVVNAIQKDWLNNWQKDNWINSQKQEVKNLKLWKELLKLISYHKVDFVKVKGHADNELNNLCDKIAVQRRDEYKNK